MCAWNPCPTKVKLFSIDILYVLSNGWRSTNVNPHPGFVGFGGWWELGEEERVFYLEIKLEVEVGVHETRSRFTPRLRPSSRQITGHKVLNAIPIKNYIYIWGTELFASSFLFNCKPIVLHEIKFTFYLRLRLRRLLLHYRLSLIFLSLR